ncbi:cobalamin biosynthesis protein [Phyllobacterium myrsinacearum]|uniref:Precorrin methylase n=1 Tax=Phyllobacterium myrsinacearum TaxID=28101 RepID=A0A2S9JXK4_9HYPH|nr:cobalamin biosynthesis protein [Phyllobacterium myrsinacearum]PRD58075.1 precorrin methylase [Phyllobacterium myrsinacearum]PWV96265.1 cobalt-precorrin 5A hydrolase/precorrin-3B C17-methyltransferase [Phyllobacterium myrsinacearum]RZS83549.1 cobalt-precorrin 5A hydrolase/precorrin-3B C17-methyltransferase [Phyllobacterium myrsinacearum]RZV09745.1 cobalt-precorrin 5A hydrolase/precorrin-3B C17-methyltransferase [Phyllobacterium myrsinacearum]
MIEEPGSAARYTLGLGCERGCDPAELRSLAESVLHAAAAEPRDLAGIYSLDARADEPAMVALAALWQLPFLCFDAATLERETPRLANPSRRVFELTGSHGVAEAAALAAAGPDGALVIGKTKSAHATAALARKR